MSNAKVSDDDQCVEDELGACRSCGCPRIASPEGEEETPHPKIKTEFSEPYTSFTAKLDPDLYGRPKDSREIFIFPTAKLAPGERAEVQLIFPQIFHLNKLVALDVSLEGVFLKDIRIGERSLVVSGCPMPAAIFKLDSWPMSYEDPHVPEGVPLVVIAQNDSGVEKIFKMGVVGTLSP